MKLGICLGLSAGVALLAATGCAQTQNVVRGQSPAVQTSGDVEGPIVGTAPGYGEKPHFKNSPHDFKPYARHYNHTLGFDDGAYDGKEQFYANHRKHVYDVGGGSGCPACDGGMSCPPGGCPYCGCGCDSGCPHHYQTYSYNGCFGHGGWPRNLVYPPPVLPAGMVQYPYYTLRGPTDFFMK